jgi:hypothetical protein
MCVLVVVLVMVVVVVVGMRTRLAVCEDADIEPVNHRQHKVSCLVKHISLSRLGTKRARKVESACGGFAFK